MKKGSEEMWVIDYEELQKRGYDAVEISSPKNILDDWDCQSIVVLNLDVVAELDVVKERAELCPQFLDLIQEEKCELKDVPFFLRSNEICEAAADINPSNTGWVPDPTQEMLMAWAEKDGEECLMSLDCAFGTPDVDVRGREDISLHDIYLKAVENNGMALMFVKEQTPDICQAAVRKNKDAASFVGDKTMLLENVAETKQTLRRDVRGRLGFSSLVNAANTAATKGMAPDISTKDGIGQITMNRIEESFGER